MRTTCEAFEGLAEALLEWWWVLCTTRRDRGWPPWSI